MPEHPIDPDEPEGDGPQDPSDGIGPFADEARKLFGVVQQWAQRTMPEPPSGHGGPECQWCPLCQFASILRGEHPEVTDRVVEAGTAMVGAFRALLDSATTRPASDAAPGERGPERPKPAPRVQRIRLDEPADPPAGTGTDSDDTDDRG